MSRSTHNQSHHSLPLIHQITRQQRQIRVLEGMLPICSFCKRIRDEQGQWRQLETFITERSGASFSHTFCEQCGRAHYPGLVDSGGTG